MTIKRSCKAFNKLRRRPRNIKQIYKKRKINKTKKCWVK